MFGIVLYSKYTGEHTILGSQYDTYKEAEKYAKSECLRCNRFEIITLPKNAMWVDKKKGFIQLSQNNQEEYERWNKKKSKTLTSMNEVVTNAEKNMEKTMRQQKLGAMAVVLYSEIVMGEETDDT